MTGYHDYLIMLPTTERIAARTQILKNSCAKEIGDNYDSRYAKAHVTIQYWPRKKPFWIEPLMPNLERELLSLPPVTLEIENFGFFGNSDKRTIYAKLKSTEPTELWFKQLRRFFTKQAFLPHITIAKNISIAEFNKLWPTFRNSEWTEQFNVDKLTILKREMIAHDKSYRKFREMPFNRQSNLAAFVRSKIKTPLVCANGLNVQQFSLF